jgi:hypothetical protein
MVAIGAPIAIAAALAGLRHLTSGLEHASDCVPWAFVAIGAASAVAAAALAILERADRESAAAAAPGRFSPADAAAIAATGINLILTAVCVNLAAATGETSFLLPSSLLAMFAIVASTLYLLKLFKSA